MQLRVGGIQLLQRIRQALPQRAIGALRRSMRRRQAGMSGRQPSCAGLVTCRQTRKRHGTVGGRRGGPCSERHTSRRAVWARSSAPPPLPPAGAAEAWLPACWSIDAAPRLVEGPPAAEGFRRPNACSLSLRRSASPPPPGGIWAAPRAQSSAQARHSLRQLLAAGVHADGLKTAQQSLQTAQQSNGQGSRQTRGSMTAAGRQRAVDRRGRQVREDACAVQLHPTSISEVN